MLFSLVMVFALAFPVSAMSSTHQVYNCGSSASGSMSFVKAHGTFAIAYEFNKGNAVNSDSSSTTVTSSNMTKNFTAINKIQTTNNNFYSNQGNASRTYSYAACTAGFWEKTSHTTHEAYVAATPDYSEALLGNLVN